MNIDEMKVGEVRKIMALFTDHPERCNTPFQVGKSYLIRTVTMTWTGRVEEVEGDFLVISDPAWIADTGRFSEAVKNGEDSLNEVEPVDGPCFIGLGSIIDAQEWKHPLPRKIK